MTIARSLAFAAILFATWPSEAQPEPIDLSKVFENSRLSLVKLEVSGTLATGEPGGTRFGSGVIVGPDGVILTALHVVGSESEWQKNPDGSIERYIQVTRRDKQDLLQSLGPASVTALSGYDIAVLSINAKELEAVAIDAGKPTPFGNVAILSWDPNLSVSKPLIGQLTNTDRAKYGDRLTIFAPMIPGNSGAPILNAESKLIGIVTNKMDEYRTLAIPIHLFVGQIGLPQPQAGRSSSEARTKKAPNNGELKGGTSMETTGGCSPSFINNGGKITMKIEC